LLEDCRRRGALVAAAGNGGSAATAGHLATDWARQAGLRVLDLSAQTPLLTATANDDGYATVFAAQVERMLTAGDLLLVLSTSGSSPNILDAAMAAHARMVTVVALTGQPDSPLGKLADLELCADTYSPEVAEDVHMSVSHAIALQLRRSKPAEGSR
jgi:D-sedoheptulose 7-phosphate isomerase